MSNREYLNVLSWDALSLDVRILAANVLNCHFEPNIILGVAYGGIIPATLMYFALPETRYAVLYPAQKTQPEINALVRGKRVLVVDDLAITEKSLRDVVSGIATAKRVKIACLYHKTGCRMVDFSVRPIGPKERIVFPWYTVPNSDGAGSVDVMKYKGRYGKYEPLEDNA